MKVVELSKDGNSKIGVVCYYPLDIKSIPVTQLQSINADGSYTSEEISFDRKLSFQVRNHNFFLFWCILIESSTLNHSLTGPTG